MEPRLKVCWLDPVKGESAEGRIMMDDNLLRFMRSATTSIQRLLANCEKEQNKNSKQNKTMPRKNKESANFSKIILPSPLQDQRCCIRSKMNAQTLTEKDLLSGQAYPGSVSTDFNKCVGIPGIIPYYAVELDTSLLLSQDYWYWVDLEGTLDDINQIVQRELML